MTDPDVTQRAIQALAKGMASADGFPGAGKPEAYERDAEVALHVLSKLRESDPEAWAERKRMTPEERKAIAMRHPHRQPIGDEYPNCCSYHEGFDAALALLVGPHKVQGRWVQTYTIEPPSVAP